MYACTCAQSRLTLPRPHGLLCPRDFSGKDIPTGCRFLLQGIFATQGLNLCLLHKQADSLPSEPPGKPVKYIQNSNFKENNSVAISTVIMLCSHHLYQSPKQNKTPQTHNTCFTFPNPTPRFLDFIDLPFLDISFKWNQIKLHSKSYNGLYGKRI